MAHSKFMGTHHQPKAGDKKPDFSASKSDGPPVKLKDGTVLGTTDKENTDTSKASLKTETRKESAPAPKVDKF
jgi:hypothetical protein